MKTETFTKQAPLALLAIMQHAVANDLPTPTSIDVYTESQTIAIRVVPGGLQRWLDTVVVDTEDNLEMTDGYQSRFGVRLPIGIQFQLNGFRTRPLAVSA